MHKRPISVTLIGCLYIAVGAIGFLYHSTDFRAAGGFAYDVLWIELVRVLAIVSGIFLLRGKNWARWLAIAWMAFHVVLSAFHSLPQVAVHCLFLAVISWCLFRPNAASYFRTANTGQPQ